MLWNMRCEGCKYWSKMQDEVRGKCTLMPGVVTMAKSLCLYVKSQRET